MRRVDDSFPTRSFSQALSRLSAGAQQHTAPEGVIKGLGRDEIGDYCGFWRGRLTPQPPRDRRLRWARAIFSVHAPWQVPARAFLAYRALPFPADRDQLLEAVVKAGIGLHERRVA